MLETNLKKVSVVIPVRNEEKYIDKCIRSILSQDYPQNTLELIFVDGASEDNTVKIIKNYIKNNSHIRVLDNPKKFVQYALNVGIKAATGEYIVRMDAHSEYEKNYVSKCVEYLEKTDASDVGGPMIARGNSRLQRVIAASYHSKFALGGGKNHDKEYEGYADTVYLGAFKRQDILSIGLYDERLIRNEDDDLSFRMIKNRMKIYITPEIKSVYYPRSTYKALFKQYFEYGLWKVAVIKKHNRPARLTHLIPLLFVVFLLLFGIGSFFSKSVLAIFSTVLSTYLILNMYFSFNNHDISSISDKFRLMLVHIILHVSYGIGFWIGIFKFWNTKW